MENRVGDTLPTAAKLAELQKKLSEVLTELEKFCITLTKDERKHLPRSRKDADPMMQRVADLAAQQSITVPGIDAKDMHNDLALAALLVPLIAQSERILQLLSDTTLQADGEAWQAFLAFYGVLSSLAPRNADIQNAMAPGQEFMKYKRRTSAPAPTP